jgi:hypothetical protein
MQEPAAAVVTGESDADEFAGDECHKARAGVAGKITRKRRRGVHGAEADAG